jgi:hypothetical protein
MPIRTGKLGKICIKCNMVFIPTGRSCKLCPECSGKSKSWIHKLWLEQQKRLKKEEIKRTKKKSKKKKGKNLHRKYRGKSKTKHNL